MESALNPREIQSRIRAGATIDQVAAESGVPAAQVEPFATPVLAERQHQARNALGCPVRRRGETGSNRTLRTVVDERLLSLGVDSDSVEWDAWRTDDRLWLVVGRYTAPGSTRHDARAQDDAAAGDDAQDGSTGLHEPQWRFDPRARYSVAVNDEARLLIGEASVDNAPRPRGRLGAPVDHEPTVDLFDEQAMLRATQDAAEMTLPLPTGVHLHGTQPGLTRSPADYAELAAQQGNAPREVRPAPAAAPSGPSDAKDASRPGSAGMDVTAAGVRVVEERVVDEHVVAEPTGDEDAAHTSEPLGMPRPQYLRPERIDIDPDAVVTPRSIATPAEQATTDEPAATTDDPAAGNALTPGDGSGLAGDAGEGSGYVDTELEQVDGVYDFVPTSTTELDALYDMLQGFNEDSVNIYEGLDRLPPMVGQDAATPASADGPAEAQEQAPVPRVSDVELLGIEVTEQNLDVIETAGTPDALALAASATTDAPEPRADATDAAPVAQAHPAPSMDADVVATGWPGTMGTEREPETGLENPVDHRADDEQRAAADTVTTLADTPPTDTPTDGAVADAPAPQESPSDAAPATTDATVTGTGDATPGASETPARTGQPEPSKPDVTTPETSKPETSKPETSKPQAAESETEETTSIRPRPKRRKRAAVPSWDEIMFGGPGRS